MIPLTHNNPDVGYPTLGNELHPMIIVNNNKAMLIGPLIKKANS